MIEKNIYITFRVWGLKLVRKCNIHNIHNIRIMIYSRRLDSSNMFGWLMENYCPWTLFKPRTPNKVYTHAIHRAQPQNHCPFGKKKKTPCSFNHFELIRVSAAHTTSFYVLCWRRPLYYICIHGVYTYIHRTQLLWLYYVYTATECAVYMTIIL